METGKEIAERRKNRGLSQEALGGMLGVTGMAVSKWERGLALPCRRHRAALRDLLGLETEEADGEQTAAEQTAAEQTIAEPADQTAPAEDCANETDRAETDESTAEATETDRPEAEEKTTFFSVLRREYPRVLSGGVMIASGVCRLLGTVPPDVCFALLSFSAAAFCAGTMARAARKGQN